MRQKITKYLFALSLFVLSLFFVYISPLESSEQISEGILIHRNIASESTGPRIALITFISEAKDSHRSEAYCPYPEMVQFGTRSKELYCQKHGYDFIIGSQKMYECDGLPAPDKDRLSIHWMKVPMLARFLSEYDWVVWTDADSIFLNPNITLESLIDDSYDLIFGSHILNSPIRGTGHIFVKNSQWSREFLHEWWSYGTEIQDGYWDLESLEEMLSTKQEGYLSHLKSLPVRLSDLSVAEYEPGDFIVHFYSCHGKELYEIFKVFEEKYGYIIDDLEKELFENSLLKNRYTDHIRAFKKIFASIPIRGLLEFGLGSSTQVFLDNVEKVVSIEFVTNALNPDWLNMCLQRYQKADRWSPIAFLSGCSVNTYNLGSHKNLQIFQASSALYEANSLASSGLSRSDCSFEPYFLRELKQCVRKVLKTNSIDIAFVDSGLILRGELVQLLFNRVPIIAAHDFPENPAAVNPRTDVYGYSFISADPNYEEIFIGPPACMQGIKFWIIKNDPKYSSLIQTLKDLAQV